MSTTPAPAAVPMTVLHASKEYLACTPKQRLWVDTFLASQDAMRATQTAYPSAKYQQACSAQLRVNFHIRAALNVALGLSEYEMFLGEVQREIQHAPVGSDRRIRALAMYARMKWGDRDEAVKSPAAPEDPKPQPDPAPTPDPKAPVDPRVPATALKLWLDENNVCIGYRDADGEDVKL
jgi:hypothetical protein